MFDQKKAKKLSSLENIILICGRYEGIDERVVQILNATEISIGDYVLSSGSLAAAVLVDAVVRLVPGVLGAAESTQEESFGNGWLEYPQYTRPANYKNWSVPEVLMSGNHAEIERWRRRESLKRTCKRRPDLLKKIELSAEDKKILEQIELE